MGVIGSLVYGGEQIEDTI